MIVRNFALYNTLTKYKGEVKRRRYLWKVVGVWVFVIAFTWPVFRSGGRANLTLFDWIKNHSIWGPPVEYVPEELYSRELEGTWIDDKGNLRW